VDLLLGGSGWWTVPRWRPHRLFDAWERANAARALEAPGRFARHVGAPIVHGSHSGALACPMPGLPPLRYRGTYEPMAGIWAADGTAIAVATGPDAQVVVADLPLRRATPVPPPDTYWLTPPGPLPLFAWYQQRWHGRRWYARNQRNGAVAAGSLVR
jgi:hypothetical protein